MSDEQPAEKPTVEIARPPDWAIALTEKVVNGFDHLNDRLDTVESNLDIQGASVREVSQRVTRMEQWKDDIEDRLRSNSQRARSASEVDATHDAAIAELHKKVDHLTSGIDKLVTVTGNPTVRKVAYALATALLGYLAAKGWLVK